LGCVGGFFGEAPNLVGGIEGSLMGGKTIFSPDNLLNP